jgi:hypothetical protein
MNHKVSQLFMHWCDSTSADNTAAIEEHLSMSMWLVPTNVLPAWPLDVPRGLRTVESIEAIWPDPW